MTLRVTRSTATVAGAPATPAARLHRIGIQVLSSTIIPPLEGIASNNLSFTQTAVSSLKTPEVISSLVMQGIAPNPLGDDIDAVSELSFTQTAKSSLETPEVISTLVIGQNITAVSFDADATSNLVLSHSNIAPLCKAAAFAGLATSNLTLTQTIQPSLDAEAVSELQFTNTAVGDQFREIVSELVISDQADTNLDQSPIVASALVMTQTFLAEPSNVSTCDYAPVVGFGSYADQMPVSLNPLSLETTIRFFYPSTGPITNEVTLRSPEFGDRSRYALDRIFRESTGGTLQTFRDDTWPTEETIAGQVIALKEATAQAYLDFIVATLGQEIGFDDWEGRSFSCMMLNTTDPIVRTRDDQVDVSFELEIFDTL